MDTLKEVNSLGPRLDRLIKWVETRHRVPVVDALLRALNLCAVLVDDLAFDLNGPCYHVDPPPKSKPIPITSAGEFDSELQLAVHTLSDVISLGTPAAKWAKKILRHLRTADRRVKNPKNLRSKTPSMRRRWW